VLRSFGTGSFLTTLPYFIEGDPSPVQPSADMLQQLTDIIVLNKNVWLEGYFI
jgi:hypothetical protein